MEKRTKKFFRNIRKRLAGISPVVFVLLGFVFLGTLAVVKYFRIDSSSPTRTIQVKITGENWTSSYKQYEGFRPPYWYAEQLHANMSAYNGQGRVIATIDFVEKYPRSGADYDIYLIITVKGYFDSSTKQFIFNGQPIIIGRQIKINYPNIDLVGDIIDDDYSIEQRIRGYKIIQVVQKSIDKWRYDAINIGDVAVNGNETIAEVLDKKYKFSNLFDLENIHSALQLRQNNDMVDATLKLKVLVEQHSGIWYYGGHQRIAVGSDIWISLENSDIVGATITSVTEDE